MMSPLRIVAIAGVFLAGVPLGFQTPARDTGAPQAATGTASLSGVVVHDLAGRPLRRVSVTVSGASSHVQLVAITDDAGTFSFTDLPADRYNVGAYKAGFLNFTYGAKRPGRPGTTIPLENGQQKRDVTVRLQPGAVLTGIVRDATGEPLPGARVVALHLIYGYDTGERTLAQTSGGFGEQTDDRGAYRIYGLPPDDYYVVASAGSLVRSGNELRETTASEVEWATRQIRGQGSPTTMAAPVTPPDAGPAIDYAPVFYPGAYTQTEATAVSLKEGEERTGVDLLLGWTRTARILGSIVSADGAVPPNLQVNVIAHETIPGIPFSGFGQARVAADGTFASPGLPPGDYTVMVRVAGGAGPRGAPTPASASALFGMATLTVSGTDITTTLPLQKGVTVSGTLAFDGDSLKPPSDLSSQRVSLTAMRSKIPTLGVPSVTVDASGHFTFTGVTPGRYRLSIFPSGGWKFRSAMFQNRDIADIPLEVATENVGDIVVTLNDRSQEITGDLLDADGHPATEYSIVVFAADPTYWLAQSRRIQSTRPGGDGHFRLQNLPPGEYFIAAVTDVEQGEWYDPSFLSQLQPAAQKITLAEGEKKVQNFKLAK